MSTTVDLENDPVLSELLFHIKHHYEQEKMKGLEMLYMEYYGMDEPCISGIYSMVSKLFYQLMETYSAKEQNKIMEDMFVLSTPSQNWKCGGKNFGMFPRAENLVFTEHEIYTARIFAMCSTISLTLYIKFSNVVESVKDNPTILTKKKKEK